VAEVEGAEVVVVGHPCLEEEVGVVGVGVAQHHLQPVSKEVVEPHGEVQEV
jgi:hypothetical protein